MRWVQETMNIKIKELFAISIKQRRGTPNITENPESKEIFHTLSEQRAPILCNTFQPSCDLKCLKNSLINCSSHKQQSREVTFFLSCFLKLNSAAGQQLQRTKHCTEVFLQGRKRPLCKQGPREDLVVYEAEAKQE